MHRTRLTSRDKERDSFDYRRVYAEYRATPGSKSSASESKAPARKAETLTAEDLLCNPGRKTRPEYIAVLVRGLPGSGKTYVSKLLKVWYHFPYVFVDFITGIIFFYRIKK
jgi:YLP motif-containing protein 1